jgi:acetyltransferase-like isoleucine patch superfamily enzyme
LFLELQSGGACLPSLIAPSAHISPSVKFGGNTIVFPGVYLGCEVEVGHLCCFHGGAVVEHHAKIGHNVLLGASATIGSFSVIESHSFAGNGVVTVPEGRIGRGALVGSGALVVKAIPPHVIAYGNPATAIRSVRPGDEVPSEPEVLRLAERGLP